MDSTLITLEEALFSFLPPCYRHTAALCVAATVFFNLLYFASRILSPILFSDTYTSLKPQQQLQWDTRVVAFIHASIQVPGALYSLVFETHLYNERVLNTTALSTFWLSLAVGYFAWDTFICLRYFKSWGVAFLVHGLSCLLVYLSFLYPAMHYYACFFLLFEISTPFLNMHWFLEKKKGGIHPLIMRINGALLVIAFVVVRLCLGVYFSYHGWVDLLHSYWSHSVPLWITVTQLSIDVILNGLNFYWFYTMVGYLRHIANKQEKAKNM